MTAATTDNTGKSDNRTVRRWISGALLALIVLAAGALGSQVVSGRYEVHPVLTGSMRPGFSLGSIVILKRVPTSTLTTGDVILFHRPDIPSEIVVHRIYSMTEKNGVAEIQTKGDDNPVPDAWTVTLQGSYAYQAVFTVPFVGYASLWIHRPDVRFGLIFGVAGVLLLSAAYKALKKPEEDEQTSDASPAIGTTLDHQPESALTDASL